jgi:hypothetical protein
MTSSSIGSSTNGRERAKVRHMGPPIDSPTSLERVY